jgi:hypothetical protein
MARLGETLEQLAVRYYGDEEKAIVIRAANGFVHPDNGRLAEGERVEIPEVTYYSINERDTWSTLANRFLSSPSRARFLAEMNGFNPDEIPAKGTIIKSPYHLRHIFAKGESLKSVTRLYYKRSRTVDWLRQYNAPAKKKYGRGEVIIVPLIHLELTKEESERISAFRVQHHTNRDAEEQEAARKAILELKKAYEKGRYVEIVASASKLVGYGKLTVPQEIGVHNYLAFAYVALDEKALAVEAFKRALTLQPEMELSSITNSPKIIEAFNEAKNELEQAEKTARAAGSNSAQKKKK